MVPGHCSFEYFAFESGAEVHGLEHLLGLLENLSWSFSRWEEWHGAGLRPLDMCEERVDRKLGHKYTLLRSVTIFIISFLIFSLLRCMVHFLVVVLVIAIAISSVATISRSIASVV